jgi:hypothetical protein
MSTGYQTTWLAVALATATLGCGRAPRPEILREWAGAPYEFCIGVYTGATPVTVGPRANLPQTPVFTGADVSSVPCNFVADPFVVRRDGTWYLFFELLNAVTGQGDIGLATSRDGWTWQFRQTVLDEPFHLSYPFVFEWNGAWYMLPEGARSGALTLYHAVDFPLRWEPDCKLLEGEYVDTTLLQYAGRWWMFTMAKGSRDLLLFMADGPRGPWTPHPASPLIRNNGHITRGGGRITVHNGTPLRFTQDVEPTYGNALRAFRITTLTDTEYAEEPATAEPVLKATGRGWRAWGMHQLDPVEVKSNQWQAMVDGLGPALPDRSVEVEFANGALLDGFSIRPNRIKAGDGVLLRYFMSGIPAALAPRLTAFVHFSRPGEQAVFQADFELNPELGCYESLVHVPADAPPGRYEMRVGLYFPVTGQRVPLKSGWRKDEYRARNVLQVVRSH